MTAPTEGAAPICQACGEAIQRRLEGPRPETATTHQRRKYCSRECFRRGKPTDFTPTCQACGKAIQRRLEGRQPEARTIFVRRKYCSRDCSWLGRRKSDPNTECVCPACGGTFPAQGRNRRIYCSQHCRYGSRVKEVAPPTCQYCDNAVCKASDTLCWYHVRSPSPGRRVRGRAPEGKQWGRPRLPDEVRPCATCGAEISRRQDSGRLLDVQAWQRVLLCRPCRRGPPPGP